MRDDVRPAIHPGLTWAAATDIGRRPRNEDAYAADIALDVHGRSPRGVFIVGDGMGGHLGGDVASALAVSILRRELCWALEAAWPPPTVVAERLSQAVASANRAIFELNERDGATGQHRAGTTVALLLVASHAAWIGHVGDSRVYRLTEREWTLLTTDHNVANREIRRGTPPDLARRRSDARHLTQALGPFAEAQIRVEVQEHRVVEPTLFVLCTDGVSEGDVVERQAAGPLRRLLAPAADLDEGCRALIEAARESTGHDNMTVVLVRIEPDG